MLRRGSRPQGRPSAPVFFALFTTLLCGCTSGCEGSSVTQPDAAMVTDVSADRGPSDAAQSVDAGVDVPPAHIDDAGWARPGWLPPFTNVRFATDPERMVERPVWVACSDGRVGCRELDRGQDCGDPTPAAPIAATQANHGRRVWLLFSRRVLGPTRMETETDYVAALMELDGPVLMAWRSPMLRPRSNGQVIPIIADDQPTSLVRFQDPLSQQEFNNVAILPGLPSVAAGRPERFRIVEDSRDLRGANLRYRDMSESVLGFSSEQAVAYVPLQESLPVRVFTRLPNAFEINTVQVHRDTMFWETSVSDDDIHAYTQQWSVRGAEPPQRLLDSRPHELRGFDTDGVTMAWVLGRQRAADRSHFTTSELWVAPYTTAPSLLRPRRILAMGPGNVVGYHVMQNGYYATGNPLGTFYIVNLSDGSYWELESLPGGLRLISPFFVSDTEVGFHAWRPTTACNMMLRIRLDSLGRRHAPQGSDGGA